MDLDPIQITCPRCGQRAAARFHGPCDACRAELCETMRLTVEDGGEAAATDTRFEPKMNVVPNQVAMKE